MTTIEKLTNLRDKIKVAFAEFDTPPAPVAEVEAAADFVEATLESGEAVRAIPTLAVGSVMSLISPDGDIPAPDGSHTLTDGTQVVVLDGIISEVVESEIPEAESPDMVEMKSDMGTLKTENENLKMSIVENAKTVDLKFAELEAKIANHNKINELLNEAFVALSEVPASTPSQPVKTETVQMSAQELIQAQTAKFEKLKLEKFKK